MEMQFTENILLLGDLILDKISANDAEGEMRVTLSSTNGVFTANGSKVLTASDDLVFDNLALTTMSGELKQPIRTITSPYAMLPTDNIILANAAVMVSLPVASAATIGKVYIIKRITRAGPVLVNVTGGALIDGHAVINLNSVNVAIKVCSDGANWWIV